MTLKKLIVVIAFLCGLGGSFCKAQELTIAAAADLQSVMADAAAKFQKETGKNVKLIYGSSGNFFQQIQNGAPFDMFFSANLDYAKKLQDAGLTEPGTFYQFAIGKIVIWVPNDSKLDVSSGLQSLLNPAVRKSPLPTRNMLPTGRRR